MAKKVKNATKAPGAKVEEKKVITPVVVEVDTEIPKYSFEEAELLSNDGLYIKLPEWKGFWFKDVDEDKMLVLTKDGEILDNPMDEYKERNDWVVAGADQDQELLVETYFSSKKPTVETIKFTKGWTRNLSDVVSVEDTRSSLLVMGDDGELVGGDEYYGVLSNY